LYQLVIVPAGYVMAGQMMGGLARRAERLARERSDEALVGVGQSEEAR
jgi:hypothetical protein